MISGVTVVTTLVCLFFITHEAAGASCARHSLRPLFSGGANIRKTSGASRRENADLYLLFDIRIEFLPRYCEFVTDLVADPDE